MRRGPAVRFRTPAAWVVLLVLAGVLFGSARPASAAPLLTISMSSGVTSAASGAPIDYRIQYAVGGEPLAGGYVEVELPATQFRTYQLQRVGGTSSTVSTPGPILVRYELGEVPAGTTGELTLRARSLQIVLGNGTTVAPTAVRLGGSGVPVVRAASLPQVTVTATARPSLLVTAPGYTPATSPVDGTTLGYDVTYLVRLANLCGGDNTFVENEGCHALSGRLALTVPSQGVLRTVAKLGPEPPFQPIPSGTTPWGPLSAPLPTSGPVSLSHFGQVSTTLTAGPGVVAQGGYPAATITDNVAHWRLSDGKAPQLELTVWVPVPTVARQTHILTARMTGSAADNGSPIDVSATGTATVVGSVGVTLASGSAPSTPLGAQMIPFTPLAFDPVTPNALSRNVIPYRQDLGQGVYAARAVTTGPLVGAAVTTVIPDGVDVAAAPAPTGWTTRYTTTVGCGPNTPDADFTPTLLPTATCVRLTNPSVSTLTTDFYLGVTRNPSVTLGPGGFAMQRFVSTITASNALPRTSSINIPIVNHVQVDGAVAVSPAFGVPGTAVTLTAFSSLIGRTSDFGPRNWSLVVTVPDGLDYTGFTVSNAPAGLSPADVGCSFTAADRRVRCTAAGDALNPSTGSNLFRVAIRATVRGGAPAGTYPVPVCGYNSTNTGPLAPVFHDAADGGVAG